ncbi:hypothetical protein BC831DRAFT_554302 [Entophlyctis helioformis]|nr:hypothetical protein BC831DRAFT_554302 [Entophlyctis helioformis]
MAHVFVQIRDLHTRFSMAGPHRCFSVTTGVFLEFVESDNIETSPRVVVLRKDTRAPITNLLGADFAAITVGDELVAINGDSFLQWFHKNEFTSGVGANLYGSQRRAIYYLSLVSGANNRLPADDTITFTFKSRATGTTYTSTINYVTNRNNACWTTTTNLYKKITNTTAPGASAADAPREFRRQLAALDTDSSAAVQAATAKGPVSAIPVSYAASSNAAAKAASDTTSDDQGSVAQATGCLPGQMWGLQPPPFWLNERPIWLGCRLARDGMILLSSRHGNTMPSHPIQTGCCSGRCAGPCSLQPTHTRPPVPCHPSHTP